MANILDKRETGIFNANMVGGQQRLIAKVERYEWKTGSNKGRFELVKKAMLNIDGEYQRDAVSDAKVLEIARSWDWCLFGVLLVVMRHDGTLWVFDGGHRLRAAFKRHDFDELPCMIYEVQNIAEEAKAFLGHCLFTTGIGAIDKHKASLCADDVIAKDTQSLLDEFGLITKQHAIASNQIKCVHTISAMVKQDAFVARRIVKCLLSISDGKPLDANLLKGFMYVCMFFKPQFDFLIEYGDKIATFTAAEFLRSIRQIKAEQNKGGEKMMALGVLALINKGRTEKHRLRLS